MARKPNYAPIIQEEAPVAKQRYYNNQALGLQQVGLEQGAEQFNQNLALQKKQIEEAKNQAALSQGIAGAGLATELYPYAKKGVTGLYNMIKPTPMPTFQAGVGAQAAQSLPTMGTATGYNPSASTGAPQKPPIGGMYEEAASQSGSVASGIGTGVATAAPYYALAKMGGQVGQNMLGDEEPGFLGKGYLAGVAESLNRPLGIEQYWAEQAGAPEGVQIALDLLNPLSPIEDFVSNIVDTHFCTAIAKSIGMSPIQAAMLRVFRNWCIANHKEITVHYLKFGGDLVDKIKESIDDEKEYFTELKKVVVDKVLEFMAKNDIQSAYETYKEKYLELLRKHTPDNFPIFAELGEK